jgi:hypothetical protein
MFRKGCSCMDTIFILHQLIEKDTEHSLETYLLFVNYRKDVTSLVQSKLWNVVEDIDVPGHFMGTMKGNAQVITRK